MGEIGRNRGTCGKIRGNGGTGKKWGGEWGTWGKWQQNGTVPFSPFFRRSKTFPTVPFVKDQVILLTEEWEMFPLSGCPCTSSPTCDSNLKRSPNSTSIPSPYDQQRGGRDGHRARPQHTSAQGCKGACTSGASPDFREAARYFFNIIPTNECTVQSFSTVCMTGVLRGGSRLTVTLMENVSALTKCVYENFRPFESSSCVPCDEMLLRLPDLEIRWGRGLTGGLVLAGLPGGRCAVALVGVTGGRWIAALVGVGGGRCAAALVGVTGRSIAAVVGTRTGRAHRRPAWR